MKDEIIRGVWKAKDTVAARHGHDARRLVEHLRSEERTSGARVVDLHTKQGTQSRTSP